MQSRYCAFSMTMVYGSNLVHITDPQITLSWPSTGLAPSAYPFRWGKRLCKLVGIFYRLVPLTHEIGYH